MKLLLFAFLSFPLWAAPSKPQTIPDVSLLNQEGTPFKIHDLKGSYLLVSFIFSRCPVSTVCPLTVELNKRLLKTWKAQGHDKNLKLLLVTLDPEFDTPKALKSYGKDRHLDFSHFILATGGEKTINDFASEFNVVGFPSGGTISHGAKSILVGPDLIPIKEYRDNEWTPELILSEVFSKPQKK